MPYWLWLKDGNPEPRQEDTMTKDYEEMCGCGTMAEVTPVKSVPGLEIKWCPTCYTGRTRSIVTTEPRAVVMARPVFVSLRRSWL